MKFSGEHKRRQQPKARDVVVAPEEGSRLQFDPRNILKPGDFELMVDQSHEQNRRGMDLAVAGLLFPERMRERSKELKAVQRSLSLPVPHLTWTKRPETFMLTVGLLKPFLPAEQCQVYAEKAWKALKDTIGVGNRSFFDDQEFFLLLGASLLLPERLAEVKLLLNSGRAGEENWVQHLRIDLENPSSRDLYVLAFTFLAYPDLRPLRPLPDALFRRIERTMDFTRTFKDSPLEIDREISPFPSVILTTAILGNPDAQIDEHGNLQLFPPPKPLAGRKTLPIRQIV